jgi:rhodanese-related sulfurtransferase
MTRIAIMKNKISGLMKIVSFLMLLLLCQQAMAQNPVNWTKDQLMEPADLAKLIIANKQGTVLFSIGPAAAIPHSQQIGMVRDEAPMKKFREALDSLPRDKDIIVYCGCCPYEHCPNVRPAIDVLKEMKFTRYKLLNLPHNIKTDWIDKGYPTEKLKDQRFYPYIDSYLSSSFFKSCWNKSISITAPLSEGRGRILNLYP